MNWSKKSPMWTPISAPGSCQNCSRRSTPTTARTGWRALVVDNTALRLPENAEGCDRPCAFCAIPLMRGKHRSTPIEDLVNRRKGWLPKGVKELILIAQDLTYYGLDLYKERRLASLVRQLSAVDGIDGFACTTPSPAASPWTFST